MLKSLFQPEVDGAGVTWVARLRKNPFPYIVLVLCLLNITLIFINLGVWVIAAVQKLFVAADFTAFYTGFLMARLGVGADLYNSAIFSTYQHTLMPGIEFEGGVLLFVYPPFVAILFSPLSFLSLEPAFYVWTIFQVVLLAWVLISLNRLFSPWTKLERLLLITSILAFWPLTNTLLLGQFSLLMLAGLLQAYIAMKDDKLVRAGLWLLILAIKPHFLLLPGVIILNRRYLKMAVALLLGGIVLIVVSGLLVGFSTWIDYLRTLVSVGSFFNQLGVNPGSELNLRGILANLLGDSSGNLINLISGGLLLLAMVSFWLLWMRSKEVLAEERFNLYFAVAIFCAVFLSLRLNPHDALLLVLPAALFYDYLRHEGLPAKVFAILVMFCPLVFFFNAFSKVNILGFIRPSVFMILIILGFMLRYLVLDLRSARQAGA